MDPNIVKLINCNSVSALREKFNIVMPNAPNIILLHDSLHSAIKIDKLEGARLIANTITLLAKKEDRDTVWKDILKRDVLDCHAARTSKFFTWEKYFAEDIARRKKKNEKARNESILHLYKTGKISIFRAFEHPKIFFTLLKLGADPFERNSKGEMLTLAIVESATLNRSSRSHLLEHMLKKNVLTIEPSGPDHKSPIEVCVVERKECLKYLVQAPGIENLKIKDQNALIVLGGYAERLMQYFGVPQLVKMLGDRMLGGKLVATQFKMTEPTKLHNSLNFVMAIKELLKSKPELLSELKYTGIPEKVLKSFMFDGKPVSEEDYLAKRMEKMQLKFFLGNTQFDIAALPAELLEMVTAHLGSEDQARLFSASKALNAMLTDYHWLQMVKVDSPMLYRQLEADTKKTWHEKVAPRIKSGVNWKHGKAIVKKLRTPPSPVQLHPRMIDEYWLASTQGKKLRLWNLGDGSQKIFKLNDEATKVEFLSSSPYEVPSLLISEYQHFGYRINNQLTQIKYADVGIIEGDRCLFNLSNNRFLISSNLMYDIAHQRTVPVNVDHGRILAAKFNPFNNLFVGLTNVESIIIMDKDLNTVTSSKWEVKLDQNNRRFAKVDIIDEYTMIATADVSRVYDLRMMKSILTIPKPVHFNGAGRGIEQFSATPFGQVWNFKTMSSESCLVFPNNVRTQYSTFVCNSKLAVFSTGVPYSLASLLF